MPKTKSINTQVIVVQSTVDRIQDITEIQITVSQFEGNNLPLTTSLTNSTNIFAKKPYVIIPGYMEYSVYLN